MDPDYDIHFSDENEFAADEAANDMAKSHFLDSIGIRDLVEGHRKVGSEGESETPDGVVLSSMPDDLGFPTAEGSVRGWDAPGDLETAPRLAPDSISLPEEDEHPPLPEQTERDKSSHAKTDSDETLNLHCPSCRGALVLMRRHLGIEGACVWCHTAIVAAESPQDRSVRIFTISPTAPQEAAIEPDKPTTIEAAPVESTAAAVETESPDAVAEEESADESFGSGFASWTAPPPQEAAEAKRTTESAEKAEAIRNLEMPDLDALYETSGFLTPSVPPADSPTPLASKFGESTAAPATPGKAEEEAAEAIPSGFGAFLQSSASESNAEAVSDSGFAAPVPWGPPARQPVAEVPSLTPPDGDASANDSTAPSAEAEASPTWGAPQSATPAEEAPADHFGAAFAAAGFGPAPSKTSPADPPSDFSLADFPSPEKPSEFGMEDPGKTGVPPSPGFSTGSSIEAEPFAMEPGLTSPAAASCLSWDRPDDEAPAALEPIGDAPRLTSERDSEIDAGPFEGPAPEASSFFGEMRTEVSASPFAPPAQSAPVSPSPFETPSARTSPPPIPEPPATPASIEASPLPLGPQVVSQPLSAEKPKVRKGFLVLMVVIVGFASGAALASFVLPVEDYVASARAFMEEKFNPGATVHQMPALPSLVGSEDSSPNVQP